MLQKYDQLLSIHISAALSGTFESAKIAAREIDAEIKVIDSASISLGLGMLVNLAAELIEKGKGFDDLIKPIAKVRGHHRAQDKIIEIVKEKIDNDKNVWLGFAHGDRKADLRDTKDKLLKEIKKDNNLNLKTFESRISSTLGCHVGPTVYAVIILNFNPTD